MLKHPECGMVNAYNNSARNYERLYTYRDGESLADGKVNGPPLSDRKSALSCLFEIVWPPAKINHMANFGRSRTCREVAILTETVYNDASLRWAHPLAAVIDTRLTILS